MFAGEGHAERTNRRFHYLSVGQPVTSVHRVRSASPVRRRPRDPAPTSTARSATPTSARRHPRRHGRSCTPASTCCAQHLGVDDHQRRADHPRDVHGLPRSTSRSRNTCAPTMRWDTAHATIEKLFEGGRRPGRQPAARPTAASAWNNAGVTGDQVVDADTYYAEEIKAQTLASVRARAGQASSRRPNRRTPASSAPNSRCG